MSIPTLNTNRDVVEWLRPHCGTGASVTTLIIAKTPQGIATAEVDLAELLRSEYHELARLRAENDAMRKAICVEAEYQAAKAALARTAEGTDTAPRGGEEER